MNGAFSRFFRLASIATSLLITACGGGGSDSNSGNASIPLPITNDFKNVAEDVSVSAFSTSESMLETGLLVQNLLTVSASSASDGKSDCSNGGFFSWTHQDADADGKLSAGDSLIFSFQGCYLKSLDDTADGTMKITLDSSDSQGKNASGQFDMSQAVITSGNIVLSGLLEFNVASTSISRVTSVSDKDGLVISSGNLALLSINNFSVEKEEDYKNAIYTMAAGGTVRDASIGTDYSFTQTSPWSGYLGEFPTHGSMEIKSTSGDTATINSLGGDGSGIDFTFGDKNYQIGWDSYSDGTLWSHATDRHPEGVAFRASNFDFVGYLDEEQFGSFPENGSLTAIFSRPIKSAGNVSAAFFADEASLRSEVITHINGASLIIEPASPLVPGYHYRTPQIEVSAASGAYSYTPVEKILVTDSLVPVIQTQSPAYREGDLPTLDASSSTINKGQHINYQWRDLSGAGIQFTSPSAAVTHFTIPVGTTKDLEIELTVSNELGDSASIKKTLHYVSSDANNYLAISGEQGNNILPNEYHVITTKDDLLLFSSSSANHVSLFSVSPTSFLDFIAPAGDVLEIGRSYKVNALYPEQPSNEAALEYHEESGQCSDGSGSFIIYELSFNGPQVDKLAANFYQKCGNSPGGVSGVIRMNSNYPLNP
ncbi:hypothetical protein PVT67_16375 [Gallaecimonas kandeliae]|uniref:hypothetical protein n=1 Tax=Gallaecimonas kandeliae TaxID=3029055 RepID=UPI00264A407E|nr:hypothetical protein [Gallaecimonas kandeliae]WKE65218.1 hypothetical protein PVT67_16375 [Gallaecimonas kandeliae]